MRLYPASPRRATRTAIGDLVVVLLLVLFAWAGVKVHDGLIELTSVGREIQDSGRALSATSRDTARGIDDAFGSAADAVGAVPVVGQQLANALRDAPRSATDSIRDNGEREGARIVRLGREQVRRTEQAANVAGWLTFLLPAAVLLALRLPPRIRLITRMRAAENTLRGAPEHILAARAAYSLPYGTLNRYTRDPFGDLAAGRHDGLLAALAEDAGIRSRTVRAPRRA
ncbi:MAG TPA: hypothetical protein VFZ00_20985 [Solirubrobacter sp.]|jgi:hypothetical protein|nr:hypothetical protein [Solirubrobacter sp.]